ncbi:MAG: hypothetical protein MRY83_19570, partial [Flavobacteriales bacterium]|nr:hypothetical protein [Flavobacteriales bacterium]
HYSYSSIPNAVINIDGAIKDTSWITNNDIPLLSFHGSDDTFVPFDSDFQEFMGEPITHVHGSQSIHARMNNLSNNNCFKAYWGKDHIPECLETAYRDTTTVMITNFLVELQTDASHACVYE